jgi:prephenate dehydratase
MKIICCGPEGSFGEEAARALVSRYRDSHPVEDFLSSSEILLNASFKDVVVAIHNDMSNSIGVLPLENSIAGSVTETYDLLFGHSVQLIDEIYIPIHHNLCVLPDACSEDIEEVFSHPMALSQCTAYLSATMPQVRLTPTLSTSEGAVQVAHRKEKRNGAICSARAAHLNGLSILSPEIEDAKGNTTRFVAFVRPLEVFKTGDFISGELLKWSCVFVLPHVTGSLLRVLQVLESFGANLTMLESRPYKGEPLFSYRFYVDFKIVFESKEQQARLDDTLRHVSQELRVLGVYRPS